MIESRDLLGIALALIGVGVVTACTATQPASNNPASSASVQSTAPPASGPTEPSSTAPTTPLATEIPAMNLTSPTFQDGADIPRKYSCDGDDVSPPLVWDGVPADAKVLVLVVDDPDAGGFVHWVTFDFPATTAQLPEDASANDASLRQGTNSFGKTGWGGPCPPSGTHHYRFRLFAVREPLDLAGSPTADKVLAAAEGRVAAEATLTGLFHR